MKLRWSLQWTKTSLQLPVPGSVALNSGAAPSQTSCHAQERRYALPDGKGAPELWCASCQGGQVRWTCFPQPLVDPRMDGNGVAPAPPPHKPLSPPASAPQMKFHPDPSKLTIASLRVGMVCPIVGGLSDPEGLTHHCATPGSGVGCCPPLPSLFSSPNSPLLTQEQTETLNQDFVRSPGMTKEGT